MCFLCAGLLSLWSSPCKYTYTYSYTYLYIYNLKLYMADRYIHVFVFDYRYASIRAIETKSRTDDQQWLTYWVLYSLITLFEITFAKVLEWWVRAFFTICAHICMCILNTLKMWCYDGSIINKFAASRFGLMASWSWHVGWCCHNSTGQHMCIAASSDHSIWTRRAVLSRSGISPEARIRRTCSANPTMFWLLLRNTWKNTALKLLKGS